MDQVTFTNIDGQFVSETLESDTGFSIHFEFPVDVKTASLKIERRIDDTLLWACGYQTVIGTKVYEDTVVGTSGLKLRIVLSVEPTIAYKQDL